MHCTSHRYGFILTKKECYNQVNLNSHLLGDAIVVREVGVKIGLCFYPLL